MKPGQRVVTILCDGVLARGVEYELSIATVSPEGNVTVSETTFTTAE